MKKIKILSICLIMFASVMFFAGCGSADKIYNIGSDVLKVEHNKGYTNYSVTSLTNSGGSVTAVVVIENKTNSAVYTCATNWQLLTTSNTYTTSDNSVIANVLPNEKVTINVKFEIGSDDFKTAKLKFTYSDPKSIMKGTAYFVQQTQKN